MAFPLTEEQLAVVKHRDSALLVSAAAGSGKTRVLVERLLDRVTEERCNIDQFLVITFTRAAAAELRTRIAQELSQRQAEDPTNEHLRRQSLLVYQASICTIDSLCMDLLRQYASLLDLDPDFRILDDAEENELVQQVLNDVLEEHYQTMDEPFQVLIQYSVSGRNDDLLKTMLLDIHKKVQSCPDPIAWLEQHKTDLRLSGITDVSATKWGKEVLTQIHFRMDYWKHRLERALNQASYDPVVDANYGPALSRTMDDLDQLIQIEQWDQIRDGLPVSFPDLGRKRGADPEIREAVKKVRNQCKKDMDKLKTKLPADSASILEELRQLSPVVEAMLGLSAELEQRLFAEKKRRGVLCFNDGEHLTVKLLQQEQVQRSLQEQWLEIMVDEYQDTNEVQNELFRTLSRNGENLFFVGDIKQSIYRFRLADPTIFLQKYKDWPLAPQAQAGEACKLLLSRNFRSRPEILYAVNDVFVRIMSPECGEMKYGEEEKLACGLDLPTDEAHKVELTVLARPKKSEEDEDDERSFLEARYVAKRLAQLLRERFQISDSSSETGSRDLRPEDVAILLRSPGSSRRLFVRALREQNIPVDVNEAEDFFQTTEISVALSLLQVIDNPHQDIPLLALLRSPLFHFSSDRLAQIRSGRKDGDFYDALTADSGDDSTDFLKQLKTLRYRAGEMSVDRLIERLYRDTHIMALFGAMEDGQRRQDNLKTLADQARNLEQSGRKGLFTFLRQMELLQKQKNPNISAAQSSGGVKILSIHKSKGLEFPVVFLSDLARKINRKDQTAPLLFHSKLGVGPKQFQRGEGWTVSWPTVARNGVALKINQEQTAEEMRLLYVAMTRAKEKLILTMSFGRCDSVLSGLCSSTGTPPDPQAVAECDGMGKWLLLAALTRPEAEMLRAGVDCPVDREDRGPAWTIRLVDETESASVPLAQPEAAPIEPPPDPETVQQLIQNMKLDYPNAFAAQLPSKLTATQLKGRDLDMEAAENTSMAQPVRHTAFARPDFAAGSLGLTGTQKGTAVHKILQYLSFDHVGSAEAIQQDIQRMVQQRFITRQEADSVAVAPLLKFFQSPLGQRLLSAQRSEREFKFSMLLPAGDFFPEAKGSQEQVLFQGIIDCWFQEEDGITVLDFKTDRTPDPELYRKQVTSYAKALEFLLETPVKEKILYFFSSGTAVPLNG